MKSLLDFTLLLENEGYLLKIVFDLFELRSRSQRFRKVHKIKKVLNTLSKNLAQFSILTCNGEKMEWGVFERMYTYVIDEVVVWWCN